MLLKDKIKKKEVIKHSGAIHIENKVTLLQRRAWNVLLANAYDDLPTIDEYTVNVKELNEILGYNSRNDKHLKESLRTLVTCAVEWDILDKDGSPEWGVTALLAQATIKEGVCTYAYSPKLRQKLHNPKMYARISLSLQNKFDSKHALALYELCVDYLDIERSYGETPFIPLDRFRKLMGIPHDAYTDFKRLNRDVIRKAIAKINEVTNFYVEVEYKQQGRKVVAVKFRVQLVLKIANDDTQADLFIDTEGLPELVAELVKAGVHRNKALRIWSQGWSGVKARNKPQGVEFADYVREKLDLLEVESAKGKVDDKGAWLVAAIRDNYKHSSYQKRKRADAIGEQIKELESEAEKVKEAQSTRDTEILEPLLDDDKNIEKAFHQFKESPLFQKEWNKYADNVREAFATDDFFAAGIRIMIKQENADQFKELDDYQQRIQEIESQIQQLKAKRRG